MTQPVEPLLDQSERFAATLSRSLSAFVGRTVEFAARSLKDGDKVSVAEADSAGVPLLIDSKPLLSLDVAFFCTWDDVHRYLAIESSRIAVHAGARPKGDPLFRYEYDRDCKPDSPAAHLHVHAHRDQFSHVMALAGNAGAERRIGSMTDVNRLPRVADLHFPLGGHRFRPCTEDILAFVKGEFGVDTGSDWLQVLNEARANWRRQQLAAAIRDCPEESARALRDLGWQVSKSDKSVDHERVERLIAL